MIDPKKIDFSRITRQLIDEDNDTKNEVRDIIRMAG
jgi:hypothetical protein